MCKTGKRILLIEDMPSVALYLKITLEQEGYLVATADTAKAAVDQIQVASGPGAFDLILTDLNLPDAAGAEILRALGRCENCPPRIVLSADGDTDTRQAAFEAGAADYIEKPFSVTDLKGVIEEKCAHSHMVRHQGDTALDQQRDQLQQDYFHYLCTLSRQLDTPMPFQKLRSLVHQLKGSAALYGLSGLADAAKQLDSQLSEQGKTASADVRCQLRDCLRETTART